MKKFSAKKFLAALSIFFATSFGQSSAIPLTLNDSVQLALANDEQIAAALADTRAAHWYLSSARRAAGPSIGWTSNAFKIGGRDYRQYNEVHNAVGNGGYTYYDNYFNVIRIPHTITGYPAYNNTFSNDFRLQIPLYTGGQLEGNIKARGYQLNAADLTLENTKQTIRYQAIAAYYEVLQQRNLLNVAEGAVRMATEQLNVIQIQYEEGAVAKADVLQMQVQLANYRQNLVTTQGNLEVAEATLLNTLGLPEDLDVDLTDTFAYVPYNLTLEECLQFALENRPDAAAAAYSLKQAEAAAEAAKSGKRPSVTGIASKSITGNGVFQQERSANWQVGVQVSWSVFDNNVTNANVKAAEAATDGARANFERVEKTIRLQTRSAYTHMKAAEENIRATAAAVRQAEESNVIAQVRYEEGVDILLTVTDAQEKLTQARTNYVTALYQYNLYRVELEKAIGIPVDIDTPRYMAAAREGRYSTDALRAASLNPDTETFDFK